MPRRTISGGRASKGVAIVEGPAGCPAGKFTRRHYLVAIKFIRRRVSARNLYSTRNRAPCIIGLSQRADRKQGAAHRDSASRLEYSRIMNVCIYVKCVSHAASFRRGHAARFSRADDGGPFAILCRRHSSLTRMARVSRARTRVDIREVHTIYVAVCVCASADAKRKVRQAGEEGGVGAVVYL